MKYKKKLTYKEYVNNHMTEKYICICEVTNAEHQLEINTVKFKGNTLTLVLNKKGNTVRIKKTGKINYNVFHEEKKTFIFNIQINEGTFVSNLKSEIKTNIITYEARKEQQTITIEFIANNNQLKSVYTLT